MNLNVRDGKTQLAIGLPAVLVAAITFADYRYIDGPELMVAMNDVTDSRREDKLYSVNREIVTLRVRRDSQKLRPEELQRLLDLKDEADRLKRLLRD